jgi:hypothetical protein
MYRLMKKLTPWSSRLGSIDRFNHATDAAGTPIGLGVMLGRLEIVEGGASGVCWDMGGDVWGLEKPFIEVEAGGDAADDEDDDEGEASSGPSPTPHCAWAFWMTLLLSSRNMRESWSR